MVDIRIGAIGKLIGQKGWVVLPPNDEPPLENDVDLPVAHCRSQSLPAPNALRLVFVPDIFSGMAEPNHITVA